MQHWVFDLDGTLVDSFPHYFSALEEIFRSNGKTFVPTMKHESLSLMPREFFQKHLGDDAVAPALEQLHARSESDSEHIRPFAGALDLVKGLRERKRGVSVWTNRDLRSARLILEHSGLAPYVQSLVSGNCVRRHKPDAEGMLLIASMHQKQTSDFVMIGDHEMDMRAGRAAGAKTVRASWHGHWSMEGCLLSDHQFYSFRDFLDWSSSLT